MTLCIRNTWLPSHGEVDILINDELIQAIGPDLNVPHDTESLDAQGMAAVPGLVNGHTHVAMTLFRGMGDDMPLMNWLENRIWPAEARLEEEDVYWGARLACLEMIRSGCVAFQDMYWHFHGIARAVEDSGLRAGVGLAVLDVKGEDQANLCKRLAQENLLASRQYSSRVRPVLTPHALYSVQPKTLQWCGEFAQEHALPIHIHLSETQHEVNTCLQTHGMRPASLLDQMGLLTPRTLLAHGIFLDDHELDLIAQRGATLVTNPTSNLKLAVGGIFPYAKAAQRGIPVALGTDGPASNNSLDLFREMKTFALIQKHAELDPTAMPAPLAWAIATGAHAPLLGQCGQIAVGNPADLLLIQNHQPEMTPNHDFISNLVYSACGHVVDTTIVAGQVLMFNRCIDGEEIIRMEASSRAKKMVGTPNR